MTPVIDKMMKEKVALWLLGSLFTVLVGLIGVVYAQVRNELDHKADKDIVLHLLQTTDEIQQDIKVILKEMPRKK